MIGLQEIAFMSGTLKRIIAAALTVGCLAACGAPSGPPGVPSSSDVNPITGSRGGSSSR
jgi:hypothetical protein